MDRFDLAASSKNLPHVESPCKGAFAPLKTGVVGHELCMFNTTMRPPDKQNAIIHTSACLIDNS